MSNLEIRPLSGTMGAEIFGADVSGGVAPSVVEAIEAALFEYGVVAIREQKLDHRSQVEFGRMLGELDIHPIGSLAELEKEPVRD